jgi:adenylate cyclase
MKSPLESFWYRIRFGLVVVVIASSLLYLRYGQNDYTERLSLWGNDLMLNLIPHNYSNNVAIVEITEEDTKVNGEWPWPRRDLALLIDRLRSAGASVIVFADVFSDDDLAKTDDIFAQSILDNGVVLSRTVTFQTIKNPVDSIAVAAAAVGFINPNIDRDGVVRRIPLIRVVNDRAYYSLGVETLRTLTGDYSAKVNYTNNGHVVSLSGIAPWQVQNNSDWRMKFNHDFVKISATSRDLSKVKDKIVVIGVATKAVNNWYYTPVGSLRNHQIQAELLESLFEHTNIVTPIWADMVEMMISILILTSILVAARNNTPYACIPVYAGGVAVVILGSWILLTTSDLAVDWVWPLLSSTSVFVLTFHYYLAHKRSHEWMISRRFGDSVGRETLKKLKQKNNKIKTTGEMKELTVMYADLRGFANLAAHYIDDAEGLVTTVHNYMDQMLPVITRNGGTVDKLIGDGIVAFWNAPLDQKNHANSALRAATEMLSHVESINASLENRLCLDIGINTGNAVVGNTGSRKKFNYTAIGKSVRTADILESLCKQYGVNILVGEQTAALIRGQYHALELDTVIQETGEAMRIYTIVNESQLNQIQQVHLQMLENYYMGDFDAAIKACRELKNLKILEDYYRLMQAKIKTTKLNQTEDLAL